MFCENSDLAYKTVTGGNINQFTVDGRYHVLDMIDVGDFTNWGYQNNANDFVVHVQNLYPNLTGSNTYIRQIWYDVRSNNIFVRMCLANVWKSTVKLL